MSNNFYQTNNKIMSLNPYNKKDLELIQFNHYLCRKENLQRMKSGLERDLFKLSYTTIIQDTGLSRSKVQRLIKWFEDNNIIKCIEKSNVKGKESIYAYISVYCSKNDTNIDTDIDTNLYSNFNGSKVVSDTDIDTDFNTSKKENLKSNIYSISYLAFTKIFNLWNSKSIIKHKKITDNMVKAYEKALSAYTDDDIVEAIENYKKILDSNFYYDYKFTLENFLKQSNGIGNFVNEGQVYINYLEQNKKATTHKVEAIDNFGRKIEIL